MISEQRPLPAARRILVKTLLIIAGTIGAILLYFLCERVFAGYPQYGTDILTYIGLTLVMATGGPARSTHPPPPAAAAGPRQPGRPAPAPPRRRARPRRP